MPHLRLVRGRVQSSDDVPTRRAADRSTEERFRYPAEELWEVSCRTEDEQPPAPAPESRAS